MNSFFIVSALILAAQLSNADVLPAGQKSVRIEYAQGTANEFYAGNTKLTVTQATTVFTKRDAATTNLSSSFGIGNSSQIDFGLTYTRTDFGSTTVEGVSEVSAHYLYEFFKNEALDLNASFGLRTPADGRSGNDFATLSDGLVKFDYSFDIGYSVDLFKFGLNSRYTDRRQSGSFSQTLNQLSLAYYATDSLQFVASYLVFRTSDGVNITDSNFANRFSQVNEAYDAYNIAAAYSLANSFSVDARYGQKLASVARNTDLSSTLGVGFSKYW